MGRMGWKTTFPFLSLSTPAVAGARTRKGGVSGVCLFVGCVVVLFSPVRCGGLEVSHRLGAWNGSDPIGEGIPLFDLCTLRWTMSIRSCPPIVAVVMMIVKFLTTRLRVVRGTCVYECEERLVSDKRNGEISVSMLCHWNEGQRWAHFGVRHFMLFFLLIRVLMPHKNRAKRETEERQVRRRC